ncbi:MAG: type II toxin-antitoxin system VapC family toxin [Coriobacteriia bacterium]|nr:type II toxin-antitoxin system VapC family toxin [Coriobacteriia bacterium]
MSETIVVDASAIVPALLPTVEANDVRSLFGTADLHAPDLLIPEVTNALWMQVAHRRFPLPIALERAASLDRLPITSHPSAVLAGTALALAVTMGHAAYDCFYVALAMALDAPLWTADRKLAAAVARAGIPVQIRLLEPEVTD